MTTQVSTLQGRDTQSHRRKYACADFNAVSPRHARGAGTAAARRGRTGLPAAPAAAAVPRVVRCDRCRGRARGICGRGRRRAVLGGPVLLRPCQHVELRRAEAGVLRSWPFTEEPVGAAVGRVDTQGEKAPLPPFPLPSSPRNSSAPPFLEGSKDWPSPSSKGVASLPPSASAPSLLPSPSAWGSDEAARSRRRLGSRSLIWKS